MACDVFISYSSVNKATADAVCHALEQNDIRCWIAPRDIPGGSMYGEQIVLGIRGCKVFLLIYSDEVNRSVAVQKELERAVLGYKKTIVPFRIEDAPMNDNIEFFLGDIHWIDAYPDDTDYDDLVNVLKGILHIETKETLSYMFREDSSEDHNVVRDIDDTHDTPKDEPFVDNTIILQDESGKDITFEFLDLVDYQGDEYVVLMPTVPNENNDTESDVVILKIEDSDGISVESYVAVDDQGVLNTVFDMFKEKFQSEFTFIDD